MPVFDLSLSRQTNGALAAAMRMLGLRACHGCPERHQGDMLAKLIQNNMQFTVLRDFDAVCNLLGFAFVSLDLAYPDAQFIFVDRDPDAWVQDTLAQLARNNRSAETKITLNLPTYGRLLNLGCLHTDDAAYLRSRYDLRRAEILDYFKGREDGKLLVMNMDEGWTPLATFLGKTAPNAAFPQEQ